MELEVVQISRLPRKNELEVHQILPLPRTIELEAHQILRLPRKIELEVHQIVWLPRKMELEVPQLLRLSRKIEVEVHQILRLPRKMELEVHQILRLLCKAYERVDCHEKIRQTNKSQRQRHALPLPRKMAPQKRQVVLLPESCQVLCMLYKKWDWDGHENIPAPLHAPTLSGFLSTCKKLQVLIAQPDGPKARSNQLLKASRLSSSNFCDGAPSQWLKLTNSDSPKLTNLKSKKIQEQEWLSRATLGCNSGGPVRRGLVLQGSKYQHFAKTFCKPRKGS